MAVAGLDSATAEIEFVAGTWTDVSSYVRWDQLVRCRFGRASEFDDVSAGTLDLALRNEDGRFTPDNPTGPYWPNITENKRIRISGVRSSQTYRFFTGFIAAWEPTFPTADSTSTAVVAVSAVDIIGQLDRHLLEADYLEQALALARSAATWTDVYPFDDAAQAVTLRNAGVLTTATALGTATLIPTVTPRRGSATVQTGDDALALPGYLTFTPSGTAGPVLRVVPQATLGRVDVWLRFPVTTLPAPGIPLRVLDTWAGDTYVVLIRLINNSGSIDLEVISPGGTIYETIDTAVNDDTWRKVTLSANAGTPTSLDISYNDTLLSTHASVPISTVTRLYLGGATNPNLEGKQSACVGMDVAGLVLTSASGASPAAEYARPTAAVAASTRFADFLGYISGYYTGGGVEGADDRQVWRSPTVGRTVLDCVQELARTVGGAVFARPSGTLSLLLPDMISPPTAAATIDVEVDADALAQPPLWRRAVDSIPTRVTVNSPAGAATIVNTAAETAGGKRDLTVASCAATLTDAASIGAAFINAAPGLRLAQLAVDLVTAANNLWSSVFWQPAPQGPVAVAWFGRGPTLAFAPISPTLAVGELLVLWAYNGSSTLPTIGTTGWTTLRTVTSSGGSLILAWKIATSTEVSAGQVPVTFTGTVRSAATHDIAVGRFNPAYPFTLLYPSAAVIADGVGPIVLTMPTQPGPALAIVWFFAASTTATLTLNGTAIADTSDLGVTEALSRQYSDDPLIASTVHSVSSVAWNRTASWAWDGVSRNSAVAGVQIQFADSTALRPGARLRVTNLPSATFGLTYTDETVQGWSLDLGVDRCVLTFDTTPADDPVRGVVASSEYGRAGAVGMTVTGGTARATTSNGTLILTTAGGNPTLTVDSTAYPLDLNVNGERVTITAAPGGSSSPQTVTTTARGVAPTVARAHSVGETVDIWHAAQAPL